MSLTDQSIQNQSTVPPLILPPRPVIYEINTWLWLGELSSRYGMPVTLATVPTAEWDALANLPIDAVWFMGVWERSPAGVAMALKNESLRQTFLTALPNMTLEDVVGSPYCVRRYEVDPALGAREGLAAARTELAARQIGIILDFVPNHVAPDHPWTLSHPEYFIQGTAADLRDAPNEFFRAGDVVIANGRDPHFPPWPDVAQLNAFHPGLRAAMIETLRDIAGQCDGIRIDMAMLMNTDIFKRTWGERAGNPPEQEYWLEILPSVRLIYPYCRLIAEVYWDMERTMQAQGFHYCYDKGLYDQLVKGTAATVRHHLAAENTYQERLIRFIENHDEPRAAGTFAGERAYAVALAALTLPGAKLLHQGQLDGLRVQLPVFLSRRPQEAVDPALQAFYRQLVPHLRQPALRNGVWRICQLNGWPDNLSYNNILAWCWYAGEEHRAVIAVNLSAEPAQARIQLAWPELAGQDWIFEDILHNKSYEHAGDELLNMGLYVELPPWGRHLFIVH